MAALKLQRILPFVLTALLALSISGAVSAQVTGFRQAIAEGVAAQGDLAAFYRARDFAPIWTGAEDADRRRALLTALEGAGDHGLPVSRYDAEALRAAFMDADTPADRGRAEIMASTLFLLYARDVQSGLLEAGDIIPAVARELPRRDPTALLRGVAEDDPRAFMRALPPAHPEYLNLQRQMLAMERVIGDGGWGPAVDSARLEPGARGAGVVALRDRLVRMGYLARSATAEYDGAMQAAVRLFQSRHGLEVDGIAGPGTLAEINIAPEQRLRQIILGMERQRWLNWENPDRGARHVLVNIPGFHAYVIDDEEVSFSTRVVVGAAPEDRVTPEFSDMMEYMVINPSWNVPRSIAVNEYLPALQANPGAASQLQLLRGGRPVSRAGIDFTQFTRANFPFDLRQPPSSGNALGRVKFIFPNQYNIYLHDTPSRSLFDRESRAFSHGCVRVHRPLELAYFLLAPQVEDPQSYFDAILATGVETQVDLEVQIPVHIVYWTAFVSPEGALNFRRDVYDRDARLWNAMEAVGVELRAVSS